MLPKQRKLVVAATGVASGTVALPPRPTYAGPHPITAVTPGATTDITITANLNTLFGLTNGAGNNKLNIVLLAAPGGITLADGITAIPVGVKYPATVISTGASSVVRLDVTTIGTYTSGGRVNSELIDTDDKRGFFVEMIDVTLIASGGAIGAAAPLVTTTHMNGLAMRFSGVQAQNTIDRKVLTFPTPLLLQKVPGESPSIVLPAVTNGVWDYNIIGHMGAP